MQAGEGGDIINVSSGIGGGGVPPMLIVSSNGQEGGYSPASM